MARVMALGFFDGVHLGHGALLTRTRQVALERSAEPAVLSFDAPPVKAVSLILSPQDRADIIRRQYGIQEVLFLHFDEALRHMPWEEFAERLVTDFGAVHLVAGYDFRFGYQGAGTAALLREKCAALGIGCDIVGKVELDGAAVSSTRIRALLTAGDMAGATRLMGHPWFLTDTVHTGLRLGRTMGFPTVNMRLSPGVLVPRHGVYTGTATRLRDGSRWKCLTNIGQRPTVSAGDQVTVESYLQAFQGSLYGEPLRLELTTFLRPERKFGSLEELQAQIALDCAAL